MEDENVSIQAQPGAAGFDAVLVGHTGTGNIDIDIQGSTIAASGGLAGDEGVRVEHTGASGGDVDILVRSSSITVDSGGDGTGIFASHNVGNLAIQVENSEITTKGLRTRGIYAYKWPGPGDIGISVQGSAITTSGDSAHGILGYNPGPGDVSLNVQDSTISTAGVDAYGVQGQQWATGDIAIQTEGGTTTTSGDYAYAVYGLHFGTAGDVSIDARDHTITTSGASTYGILGRLRSTVTGNIDIRVEGGSITTSGDTAHGIYGLHEGEGSIDINVQNGAITTSGDGSRGIYGRNLGTGDLGIEVQGGTISTSGATGFGILGWHISTGAIDIDVQGGSVTTSGDRAYGIYGYHTGTGDLGIRLADGLVTTSGDTAHGIYGRHLGTGDVSIDVQDSTISTSGADAHGVHVVYRDADSVDIRIRDAVVRATGLDAHGVQVGTLDEDGAVQGSVGVDEEGYRRQTVTVGSEVRGGSGDAAGIFLAGGGRVVVGPHGRVSAASGVAIRAAGTGQDGQPGPLSVDLALNVRPLQEVLGGGRIVNDDGTVELMANGVMLFDGAAGATDRWAPNGPWDVTARTAEDGGIETVEVYAPRTGLYESLPGLLLLLDAGAPVRRPDTSAWAQVGYGTGSGDPKHSRAGASYDFDRIEAAAGTSRNWENGFGGSLWLRHLQSEVKVDMPSGPGELELHGAGAGVSAYWRGAGGLEVSAEASLTDFDVDMDSARHGRLARDVEADLWQARLETGYRLERGNGLTLLPRAWAWHAEADLDDFTDAVGSRVMYEEESRSAAGLGVLAELARSESVLYGSLDVESLFAGEGTAVEVSGHRLASESKRTRVLVGMGGRWQGQRVTLKGGLRLADPGSKNQEVSASVSIGGSF